MGACTCQMSRLLLRHSCLLLHHFTTSCQMSRLLPHHSCLFLHHSRLLLLLIRLLLHHPAGQHLPIMLSCRCPPGSAGAGCLLPWLPRHLYMPTPVFLSPTFRRALCAQMGHPHSCSGNHQKRCLPACLLILSSLPHLLPSLLSSMLCMAAPACIQLSCDPAAVGTATTRLQSMSQCQSVNVQFTL